jgi:hypothetical protein
MVAEFEEVLLSQQLKVVLEIKLVALIELVEAAVIIMDLLVQQ